MKHIVYLSYDGITDSLGQSQVLPYIFGINEVNRYKLTIISFEKNKNLNNLRANISKDLMDSNIDWIILKYTKNPPIISTLFDLYKLNTAIYKLIKNNSIDLIHARSYITSIIALRFKKSNKIPFIFDMRGFYADERIDGKIWKKNHFIYKYVYKYFKIKERQFLQLSNHIISLTCSGKKEILSWRLPNLSPITIIPCCTDNKLFKKENIKDIKNELYLKDSDFIISYIGSVGTWYMLDEMLDFFNVLIHKKSNSKFLFVTKDNSKIIYEKCAKKNIPKSAILIKESSREMMPSYIGLSNFSIFFILPSYSKKASSPTKMGEIMNLGIPIICNSGIGDVDEIMKKSMPELLLKKFNTKEFERVIDLILNTFKADRKKIIKISHDYYSLNNGIKKYIDIYNQVLTK